MDRRTVVAVYPRSNSPEGGNEGGTSIGHAQLAPGTRRCFRCRCIYVTRECVRGLRDAAGRDSRDAVTSRANPKLADVSTISVCVRAGDSIPSHPLPAFSYLVVHMRPPDVRAPTTFRADSNSLRDKLHGSRMTAKSEKNLQSEYPKRKVKERNFVN